MTIGSLLRASALLVLFWLALLGPRAWPSLVAARDGASLPRALLLVESDGCRRDEADDLLWRCEASGTVHGSGEFHWRAATFEYVARGEEPDRRYQLGESVAVAIVPATAVSAVRLMDGDRPVEQAVAELRWLAWQPLLSLAVMVAAWLALSLTAWVGRRRHPGAIELTTWTGLPGLALAMAGVIVALAAGWVRAVPVSADLGWLLLLLVPVPLALVRTFVRVDRGVGELRDGVEAGPWRRIGTPVAFSGVAEVRMHEAPHLEGVPAWPQWRLAMGGLERSWDLATGHPRRVRRLGDSLAAYLAVPLLQPGAPSTMLSLRARRESPADDLDDDRAPGAGESDEEWLAKLARPEPPTPEPAERGWHGQRILTPRERLQRLPQGLLGVFVILAIGLGIAIVNSGGIDPFAARLLEPEVETWPAGGAIRRAAVAVVSLRAREPQTLSLLVRLAHTLPPQHHLWAPVMRAAQRVLGEEFPLGDSAAALERLDAAATRSLGRPPGPLGVLGWWELDEYWVMWLDELAGADQALAIERFNGLRMPRGLPTSEWFLVQVGRAFADERPVPFAVVVEEVDGAWRPTAVPASSVGEARRLDVTTVGESLAVLLATYPEYRPASPPEDVARWWAAIAAARGLPRVGGDVEQVTR